LSSSLMSYKIFYLIHLVSLFALVGFGFLAFGAKDLEKKRFILMGAGIAGVLAFVGGFALLGVTKIGFPGWVIVKMFCWLGLAALPGIAFKKVGGSCDASGCCGCKCYGKIALLLVFIAVAMVTFRPF
jgi:hypothetical protein